MATRQTPSKQTTPTKRTPAKKVAGTTKKTAPTVAPETVYWEDQEVYQRSGTHRRLAIFAGFLLTGAAVGAATWGYLRYKETQRELRNDGVEGVLSVLGFDTENIVIDVTGDTNRLVVTCPDTQQITYFYSADSDAAYLKVGPVHDATGEVKLKDGYNITYDLDTREHVEAFIKQDFLPACNSLAND